MAGVAYDSVGPAGGGGLLQPAPVSPVTYTHTVVSGGPGSVVYVAVNADQAGTVQQNLAVTFGGASMTSLGWIDCSGDTSGTPAGGYLQLFILTGLTAGPNTVSIAFSGSTGPAYIAAGSIAFTGYASTGPLAYDSSPGAGSYSVTVPSSTAGNLVAAFLAAGTTIGAPGSPATARFLNTSLGSGPNDTGDIAGATQAAGGSVTTTWAGSASFCAIGAEVQAPPSPSVTTASLPSACLGEPYSTTLAATGGTTPYTWSISSGSLPSWASLNASTGVISGTAPAALGSTSFTAEVTDAASLTATQALALAVTGPPATFAPAIPGTAMLPGFIPGSVLSAALPPAPPAGVQAGQPGGQAWRHRYRRRQEPYQSAAAMAGPVPVSSADSAAAAEAGTVAATLSSADAASGLDAGSLPGVPRTQPGGQAWRHRYRRHQAPWPLAPVYVLAADSSTAADSGSAAAGVPAADTAHGAEAASVHATLGSADASNAAAEAGFLLGRLSGADAAGAAEAASVRAALSGAESSAAAEGVTALHASFSQADSGHGSDAQVPSVRFSAPETASAAESSSLAAASADAGHAAEAGQALPVTWQGVQRGGAGFRLRYRKLQQPWQAGLPALPVVPSADASGPAAEAASALAAVPSADAGHAAEAASVRAALFPADTGHGADSPIGLSASSTADTSGAAEAAAVHAVLSSGDTGHAAEQGTLQADVPAGDTAGGTEGQKIAASSADAGSGTEAGSAYAVVPPVNPQRGGLSFRQRYRKIQRPWPFAAAAVPVTSADAGLGTESAFYYLAGPPDTASAAEAASVTVAPVMVSSADTGHAAEQPRNSWPSSADAAQRTAERAWWSGPLSSADASGPAAEGWQPFRFTGNDSAVAVEVLHEMGIWTYPAAGVRLEGRFWLVTARDEQGAEIVLLAAERLDRSVLELAERMQRAAVRLVHAADCGHGAEAARSPVPVTCWAAAAVAVRVSAQPAVQVTVTVLPGEGAAP